MQVGNEDTNNQFYVQCENEACGARGKAFTGANPYNHESIAGPRNAKASNDAIDWWQRRAFELEGDAFEVSAEIPIPPSRAGRKRIIPLWKLENPGESFFVPETVCKRRTVTSSVDTFHKENPDIKLTTRAVEGGVRVWRL